MPAGTRLDWHDRTAWITLDDGKVNALSSERIAEIDRRLGEVEDDASVVVLAGREGIFSAGFDLTTFARGADAGRRMVADGARLVLRLLEYPRPVLTVCTGHAYPAGAFLMLSADVRLGIDGPWRIGMNETAIGLTVPLFAIELARHRLTPPGFAAIQAATLFDPAEALRHGYLDRLVDVDRLEETALEQAKRLESLDAESFRGTKARVNALAIERVREGLERELADA